MSSSSTGSMCSSSMCSSLLLIWSCVASTSIGHVDDYAERYLQETACGLPFPDPLNNRRTFITFRNHYNRQNLTVVESNGPYGMHLITTGRPADGWNRGLIQRQLFVEEGDEAYLRSLIRCSAIQGQGHKQPVVTALYNMSMANQRWVFVNGPNWITNMHMGADEGTDFCLTLTWPYTADNNVVVAVKGCYPRSESAKWEPIFSYEE